MVCIRPAVMEDLLAMQRCNLLCLPENYQLKVQACYILRLLASFSMRTCLLLEHDFSSLTVCLACAVLLLPNTLVASASLCGRRLQRQDCGLCARQNVSPSAWCQSHGTSRRLNSWLSMPSCMTVQYYTDVKPHMTACDKETH